MSSDLKVILETRRQSKCLLYSELNSFNPNFYTQPKYQSSVKIISGHFIDIQLSKIPSFSVLLLTKPLEDMPH